MFRPSRLAVSALLLTLATPLRASFYEPFSGSSLSPAWTLSFGGWQPDTSWTPTVAGGVLDLSGFADLTQSDGQWSRAYLTRAVAPTSGDFYLSMIFSWAYSGFSAIQNLSIEALDANGDIVASLLLHDQQVSHSPGYSFFGDDPFTEVGPGYDTLANNSIGSRTMLLSRVGGSLSGNWDSSVAYSSFAPVSSGTVTAIRIHLANFWYSTGNEVTQPLSIDALEFNTTAVPEPATCAALAGVASLLLAASRRRLDTRDSGAGVVPASGLDRTPHAPALG